MTEKFKSYREESKSSWGRETDGLNNEEIKLGAILRIADATEKMAVNFVPLQMEHDRWKRWYDEELTKTRKLRRANSALKGLLKKAAKAKP